MKKTIRDLKEVISPSDFDTRLSEVKLIIERLIEQYGPDARLDWRPDNWYPYDSSPSPQYHVIVDREETEEEYQDRLGKENELKKLQEEKDLKEFERLRKKFEKK